MTDTPIVLDGSSLTTIDVGNIVFGIPKDDFGRGGFAPRIDIAESCREAVNRSRRAVEEIVASGQPAYGINTGFGDLVRVAIPEEDLKTLQANLIRSHACGVGEEMLPEEVLGMMAIRANSLLNGHSGIRWSTIETLVAMINAGIAPHIPRIGSLGASGDLCPLSHMTLGMMGEGEVYHRGEGGVWNLKDAADALNEADIEPVVLEAKEGLSLINGTSQMCLWIALAERRATYLMDASEYALAFSIEGAHASADPFDERLNSVRPHPGQMKVAARLRHLLHHSPNMISHANCEKVQDAYSFRCAPQVLGAVQESLDHLRTTIEIELNSTTDNPLIFTDKGVNEVVSGGNFHGEVLAMVSDNFHLAIHELASISERRIAKLLDPATTGLPAFLAENPGLNSGLMIVQYTAAASIAEIRARLGPSTATNIVVSAQQEDHVSMGATASWMLLKSIENCAVVIAAEMLAAVHALSHRNEIVGPNLKNYLESSISLRVNGAKYPSKDLPVDNFLKTQGTKTADSKRDIEIMNVVNEMIFPRYVFDNFSDIYTCNDISHSFR
ncbi:MAG: histidine ammonia-lyase [Candidatus Thermoplasmatota archaeon]|nr:histidine ammonia-lyase [Candidatus Thermoplasmatota archaeon]